MNKLKLKYKLMLAFGAVVLLSAITGLTGLVLTDRLATEGTQMGQRYVPQLQALAEMRLSATEAYLSLSEMMMGIYGTDGEEFAHIVDDIQWYAHALAVGGARDGLKLPAPQAPEVRARTQDLDAVTGEFATIARELFTQMEESHRNGGSIVGGESVSAVNLGAAYGAMLDAADKVQAELSSRVTTTLAATEQDARRADYILTVVMGLSVLLGIALAFLIGRNVSGRVGRLAREMEALAEGDTGTDISFTSHADEIGQMARALAALRETTVRGLRTEASLTLASSKFLIADQNFRIVFANPAALEMFQKAEADIRKDLPQFEVDKILGASIDVFHKEPTHQRRLIEALNGQHRARLEIGGRTFDQVMTPVVNAKGERLGACVEWADVTEQLAVEREVAELVDAAVRGDFTRRVDEAGKEGFRLQLFRGLNSLMEIVDRGLSETVAVMSALAAGDLTRRIGGEYTGSFLQLKDDVNRMAEQITDIARRITEAAVTVRGASQEIATGAGDLSSRTEHQASSLEETAASMEELSATVRQNADNAQQANQLAAAARGSAGNGGQIVTAAVTAMGRIEQSSKKITEIVGLIDEIAFQTNLLALNAAVEAARAGEAGKGFAVVATEVRALAQRSSRASKDIKDLIVNSDAQVREGVDLVKQAGASLEEIVTAVKKVADIVSDIAAASQEQASGIDEVSKAVTSMDEMTQQNAALVEETTAAVQSAQSQVENLLQVVGFFRTGDAPLAHAPLAHAGPAVSPEREPAVRKQQRKVISQFGGGGRAVALAEDEDWQEF